MAFENIDKWRKEKGLDLLSALERIDRDPFASDIPHIVREEARDFLHRGSQMFAPIGLTEAQYLNRADRRVDHFDV